MYASQWTRTLCFSLVSVYLFLFTLLRACVSMTERLQRNPDVSNQISVSLVPAVISGVWPLLLPVAILRACHC